MSEYLHDYHLESVLSNVTSLMGELVTLRDKHTEELSKVEKKYSAILKATDKMRLAEKNVLRQKERNLSREMRKLEAENTALKAELAQYKHTASGAEVDKIPVAKARTLAIYDSIIFAISNWSTDGQTAPDIELACQAVLFPCIYQKVMEGVEDYFFDEVPASALLVVQRGREYVRHLRSENDRFITDPDQWDEASALIRDWWINDGLPILYGARDDDWETVSPKSLDEMIVWRDQPASRALDFPLIWDGMELVKQHSDAIRESSGLASFNKQQLSTRLQS